MPENNVAYAVVPMLFAAVLNKLYWKSKKAIEENKNYGGNESEK